MFHTAQALLCEKGLTYGKHSAVHSAYGEHFAKTGLLDPKYHRWLLDAYDTRVKGDYTCDTTIAPDTARQIIAQAREFTAAVRNHLTPSVRP